MAGSPRPWWLSWRAILLLAVPASIVLKYRCTRPPSWCSSPPASACCRSPASWARRPSIWPQRTGPTIGGLLNATFGNAAELIIAIVALRAGLVELVKASITGSILGNLLLILGLVARWRAG